MPITGGVNAVLYTEQESLPKEEIEKKEKEEKAQAAAAPAVQPKDSPTAAGSGGRVFLDVAVDGEVRGSSAVVELLQTIA